MTPTGISAVTDTVWILSAVLFLAMIRLLYLGTRWLEKWRAIQTIKELRCNLDVTEPKVKR